jgi:hypothetical protein
MIDKREGTVMQMPKHTGVLKLAKYSMGVGDRFAHEAKPQLRACMMAAEEGIQVTPVWNKSNREHGIVGSKPPDVRAAVEAAVRELGYDGAFHIDADHINMNTVDGYLGCSDYFTLDVVDAIGRPVEEPEIEGFLSRHPEILAPISLPGLNRTLCVEAASARRSAGKYLLAAKEAGRLYQKIESALGKGNFITEVSMDETDEPQTPEELLIILAALADEGVPAQAIAPKFTGRFNKGVDYVGDVAQFETEFRGDVAVLAYAVHAYSLPDNLKLSVHSGSDKFSIYPVIRRALHDFGCGVHLKTAGTTWLEEVIGLAESGGSGLELAQEIYAQALVHREALCAPYAAIIDIDFKRLPSSAEVMGWTAGQFAAALRHDPQCADFNPELRQLIHVGFKIAAQMGQRYYDMVDACQETIGRNVTGNILNRHLKVVFG